MAGPVLLFGPFAPELVVWALGVQWAAAGRIAAALAVMGAAQALVNLLSEITSIYRRQEIRFATAALPLLLVFPPLVVGAHAGWDALFSINLIAFGGAISFIVSLAASLFILKGALCRITSKPIY